MSSRRSSLYIRTILGRRRNSLHMEGEGTRKEGRKGDSEESREGGRARGRRASESPREQSASFSGLSSRAFIDGCIVVALAVK